MVFKPKTPIIKASSITIPTGRKYPLFSHDGHLYHTGYLGKKHTLYYCYMKNNEGNPCEGSIKKWNQSDRIVVIAEHNHEKVEAKVQAKMVQSHLREMSSQDPLALPSKIVSKVMEGVSEEVLKELPTTASVEKNIGAIQRKNRTQVKMKSLSEIDVQALHEIQTVRKEKLVYHDSGFKNCTRFIVFATPRNVTLLSNSDLICFDATFDVVPRKFKQLWTLFGFVKLKLIPLVFVIMSHKSQVLYSDILQCLPPLNGLKFTMCDFEKAQLNAIEMVYPQSTMFSCFFHFKKNIIEKFKKLGWYKKRKPTPDSPFKRLIDKFTYLGFVRMCDVRICYDNLIVELEKTKADGDKIKSFKTYFEETWIGTVDAAGIPKPAKYSIDLWNSWAATESIRIRSNNFIESWNGHFNDKHNRRGKPGLSLFIDYLIEEHEEIQRRIVDAEKGSSEISQREHLISQLFDSYENFDDEMNYFEALQDIFSATK